MQPVVILGAGEHAVSVAETVVASGREVHAFVSDSAPEKVLLGARIVPALRDLEAIQGLSFVVAVGDNTTRQRLTLALVDAVGWESLATLVHPSASVSGFAELGPGTVVLQGAIVGSRARVGAGCIVNTRASLDHDAVMQDFASLAPGAVTGGRVHVGVRSAVGIGAVVKHGVTIGDDVVVGAASYVHRDIPSNVVAYGTPAAVVRTRSAADPYLD